MEFAKNLSEYPFNIRASPRGRLDQQTGCLPAEVNRMEGST